MAACAGRVQLQRCSARESRDGARFRRPSSTRTSFSAAASLVVTRQPTEHRARNNHTLPSTAAPALPSETVAMAETRVSHPALITVEVHALAGNVILRTDVPTNERVTMLKLQMQAATEIDVDRLVLLWNGTILKDHDVFGELVSSRTEDGTLESETDGAVMLLQLSVLPEMSEEAQLALERASEALNGLHKGSISELKGLGKPPAECLEVVAACAYLLTGSKKKIDWKQGQKMMMNSTAFLEQCKQFDARAISSQTLANVEALIALPFFSYDVLRCKSVAAANLASWVINVVRYHKIYVAGRAEVTRSLHEE